MDINYEFSYNIQHFMKGYWNQINIISWKKKKPDDA